MNTRDQGSVNPAGPEGGPRVHWGKISKNFLNKDASLRPAQRLQKLDSGLVGIWKRTYKHYWRSGAKVTKIKVLEKMKKKVEPLNAMQYLAHVFGNEKENRINNKKVDQPVDNRIPG
jgi:hypothetical protein